MTERERERQRERRERGRDRERDWNIFSQRTDLAKTGINHDIRFNSFGCRGRG